MKDSGLQVKIADTDMTSFIRRADLSRDRSEQRPERFAPGDKIDAAVTQIDKNNRKISLSIKALEIAEEKKAVEQYGSTDSGASLGDILGAALNKAQTDDATPTATAPSSRARGALGVANGGGRQHRVAALRCPW